MTRTPWEVTREMFLDEREVGRLLRAVARHTRDAAGRERLTARLDELIVHCLVFTGLRTSEFCELALADTVVGHGRPVLIVRRGRKTQRQVFVPQHVNQLIRGYAAEVRPAFLPHGTEPGDPTQPLVFSERQRPYERSGLYRRVVRILTRAGLGGRASVQLLRHTYGYLGYLRTGGNLLFVQRQLGHAHPMVTVVYAKFVAEPYAELANRVAGERGARRTRTREEPAARARKETDRGARRAVGRRGP